MIKVNLILKYVILVYLFSFIFDASTTFLFYKVDPDYLERNEQNPYIVNHIRQGKPLLMFIPTIFYEATMLYILKLILFIPFMLLFLIKVLNVKLTRKPYLIGLISFILLFLGFNHIYSGMNNLVIMLYLLIF